MDDLPLLMALRVQGVASVGRAAVASGGAPHATAARLHEMTCDGLATERTGRVAGFSLTPEGTKAFDELLAQEGLSNDGELVECYERFLLLNERVLEAASDWQVRRQGGIETANDHADPDYDASIIGCLSELHDRAKVCLDKIGRRAPRFAPYRARLDACVERLAGGDGTAFTGLLAESYHTVWFELHQDLLLTLGLQREA